MLLDTMLTIAYKCKICGTVNFDSISLFDLMKQKIYYGHCKCTKSSIRVKQIKQEKYEVLVPCIACEGEHCFSFQRKDILENKTKVFSCEKTGLEVCFIGNDKKIREEIDLIEREFDEIMDNLGYESYFKNTQVIFDALNWIHDLAEEGKLHCDCSRNDIELKLYPDKINLKCLKCKAEKNFKTVTNEDLKKIKNLEEIDLV